MKIVVNTSLLKYLEYYLTLYLGIEEAKYDQTQSDDLGNYITQVVTDIGSPINKELLMSKIVEQVPKKYAEVSSKKLRCKMASATNPWGISPEEYSKFAIHVYQYLSYSNWLKEKIVFERILRMTVFSSVDGGVQNGCLPVQIVRWCGWNFPAR